MKKVILIGLAIVALSALLFAQHMDKRPMMNMGKGNQMQEMKPGLGMGMNWDNLDELNLTKEQKAKIQALHDENKKFMNTKQAELKNLRIDKQNAMQAENYAKVKQLNKNISDMELVIANKQVDHQQDIMKELTAEQKAKLEEFRLQRAKMGKGMQDHKMMNNKMGKMGNRDKPCLDDDNE
jgi:Spy/CpxP family protein refolding chaperone